MPIPFLKKKMTESNGSALIVALGVLLVLSLLTAVSLKSSSQEIEIVNNDLTSLMTRALAESGLEHGKQYIDENKSDMDTVLEDFEENPDEMRITESLDDSSKKEYSLWFEKHPKDDKKFYVYSRGKYRGEEKTLRLEIEREIDINIDGTVSFYVSGPSLKLGGSSFVSGLNYDLPNDFDCSGSGCEPVWSEDTELPAIFTEQPFGDNDLDYGDKNIEYNEDDLDSEIKEGGGGDKDYWFDKMDKLEAGADEVHEGSLSGEDPLGTREDPQVTVVEADGDDSPKFSGNTDGAGILIVKDGAHFTGTFHFEGLVFVDMRGDKDDVDLFSSGTPNIYGATIVAAEESVDEVKTTGNASLVYSEDAVDLMSEAGINAVPVYKILEWEEL